MRLYFIFLFINCFLRCYSQDIAILKVGDFAPDLVLGKAVRADDEEFRFKQNNFYLIEFSSFGCKPCREAMPHLNSLAMRFSDKLNVICIYTIEYQDGDLEAYDNYFYKVSELVSEGLDSVNFQIYVDDITQQTRKRYGVVGVPASFLVDGNGKIVWVGNPLSLNSELVSSVVDNTFNWKEYSAGIYSLRTCLEKIRFRESEGRYWEAIKSIDSLIDVNPASVYKILKFKILARNDVLAANQYIESILRMEWSDDFNWSSLAYSSYSISLDITPELSERVFLRAILMADSDAEVAKLLYRRSYIYISKKHLGKEQKAKLLMVLEDCISYAAQCGNKEFFDLAESSHCYFKHRFLLEDSMYSEANSFLRINLRRDSMGFQWLKMVKSTLELSSLIDYSLLLDALNKGLFQEDFFLSQSLSLNERKAHVIQKVMIYYMIASLYAEQENYLSANLTIDECRRLVESFEDYDVVLLDKSKYNAFMERYF